MYDVIVVGGGPAGLSAALVLGRCRRSVLIIDAGEPRNAVARKMHGYLSRDGINPRELLRIGRAELSKYNVELMAGRVVATARAPLDLESEVSSLFTVKLEDGRAFASQKLLLATGIKDVLPQFENARKFYGRGIYHCPYCDGWEYCDKPMVAYGKDGKGVLGLALCLQTWSSNITACTDGGNLSEEETLELMNNGIYVQREVIVGAEGTDEEEPHLKRIVFADGSSLHCDALFFNMTSFQGCELAQSLGCGLDEKGKIFTTEHQCTGVPGLYMAGDADGDVEFVIVAAAEGARAAVAMNRELQNEARTHLAKKAQNSRGA